CHTPSIPCYRQQNKPKKNRCKKKNVVCVPCILTFPANLHLLFLKLPHPPTQHIAGMIIGGVVTATTGLGMIGGMFPIKRKEFLLAFAVMLVITMMAELGLGGAIWFRTLRMRSVFETQWINDWSDALKISFQDTTLAGYTQCCGYLANQNVVLSGACTTVPSTFPGCQEKIANFAVGYLGRLFTSLFGFTIANIFSFVSTVILIQTRNDEERYIRIGKKEGRSYTNVI
ncbi:hypothetical protein EDD21DRAFT_35346, partial [Dissophora ornata]